MTTEIGAHALPIGACHHRQTPQNSSHLMPLCRLSLTIAFQIFHSRESPKTAPRSWDATHFVERFSEIMVAGWWTEHEGLRSDVVGRRLNMRVFFSKNCVMTSMNMQVASEGKPNKPACMVEILLCAGVMLLNWGCFNASVISSQACVLLCLAHHMSQACLVSPKINLFDSLRLWQPFTSTNPAVCCYPSLELQYHRFAGALSNMRNIPCQYRFIQHYNSAPVDRHQLLQSFGRVSIPPMLACKH